jgi:hypothetical protein
MGASWAGRFRLNHAVLAAAQVLERDAFFVSFSSVAAALAAAAEAQEAPAMGGVRS